jgi:hypothetical protein
MPDQPRCINGAHDWSCFERIQEPDFGVVVGYLETCRRCGWRRHENICETRASGGRQQILPPLPTFTRAEGPAMPTEETPALSPADRVKGRQFFIDDARYYEIADGAITLCHRHRANVISRMPVAQALEMAPALVAALEAYSGAPIGGAVRVVNREIKAATEARGA